MSPRTVFFFPGESNGRFSASEIQPLAGIQRDCYESSLTVADLLPSDAGEFTLAVTNQEGQTSHTVGLNVSDPISMTSLISLVSAGLVALVVLIVTTAFAYKRRALCFKRRKYASGCRQAAEGNEVRARKYKNDNTYLPQEHFEHNRPSRKFPVEAEPQLVPRRPPKHWRPKGGFSTLLPLKQHQK